MALEKFVVWNGSGSAAVGTDVFFNGDDGDDYLIATASDDRFGGMAGSDTIYGEGGNDVLYGHEAVFSADFPAPDGDDELHGGDGHDALRGNNGDDRLYGDAGDDALRGDAGNDRLDGGTGADVASYRFDTQSPVAGVLLDASATGSPEATTLADGLGGTDTLIGIESVLLIGADFGDTLTGGSGGDQVIGLAGADMLSGGAGRDSLYGGDGDDALDGGTGFDTAGFSGEAGAVVADLGSGTAVCDGATDTLVGIEALAGSSYADLLIGNGGGNRLDGADGDDTLRGGGGADTLAGGAGADRLEGGAGDDRYLVDDMAETIVDTGTSGADLVIASVRFVLGAGLERLNLAGSAGLRGDGNGLANVVNGNVGANILTGAAGDDTVSGGAGNDSLYGGLGTDRLTGGAGKDAFTFVVRPGAAAGVDTVVDFTPVDDRFRLDDAAFGGIGAPGVLAAGAFRRGLAAGDAGDRIVYDAQSGRIWFDADGSGAGAAVLFARVDPGTALGAADFWIV
jgi:serralysin